MIAWLALAAEARVLAADHRGRPEGDGLVWTSTVSALDIEPVVLAEPVPRERVRGVRGGAPEWEDDRLVAVRPWRSGGTFELETSQPDRDGLRPPLPVEPSAPQQLSVEGLRFRPDEALGLVPRIGWTGPEGLGPSERRSAFRRLGDAWKHRRGATIVRVDGSLSTVPGELTPAGRVPFQILVGAFAAALALLGCLFTAHKGLEVLARRERIDAWFRDAEARARASPGSAP